VRARLTVYTPPSGNGSAPDEIPGGVVADAFYRKNGFGFQPLLEIVSNLAGKLLLRAARPLVENEALQAKCDVDGNFIVSCGNCLREFTVLRDFHISQYQNWVTCEHCGNFVLVQAGEPAESKKSEAPRRSPERDLRRDHRLSEMPWSGGFPVEKLAICKTW
jgi:hypothetical protein